MVRTSKTTTPASASASAAPTAPKTPGKKATKAAVTTTAPVVADAAPAQVVAPAAPVAQEPTEAVTEKLLEFGSKLSQMMTIYTTLRQDFKTLSKQVERELKAAQKASAKKRRSSGNRQPSGFIKPTLITDELALFLGKESGTEMARTEVSKEINQYIRTHSLQDKDNGRIIIPDSKLKKLLRVGVDEELTYFNLQRYMKHHFVKKEAIAAAAAAGVSASA
jgi:upstream activation factor subunit UAF30